MQLGTRSLTLNLGGFDRTAEVSQCTIVAEPMPNDERVICGPGTRYRLQGTSVQDPATGTLWDLAWDYIGDKVAVDLRPAGGATPTEDQPWFTGIVTIAEPTGPVLGGQADPRRGGRLTFSFDWLYDAKPERVTS